MPNSRRHRRRRTFVGLLLQNLRHGGRALRLQPAFTSVAILTPARGHWGDDGRFHRGLRCVAAAAAVSRSCSSGHAPAASSEQGSRLTTPDVARTHRMTGSQHVPRVFEHQHLRRGSIVDRFCRPFPLPPTVSGAASLRAERRLRASACHKAARNLALSSAGNETV